LENISIAIGATVASQNLAKYRVRKSTTLICFCGAENMDQVSRKNIGEDSTKKLSMLLRIPVVNSIIKKTTTEIRVARGKIYISQEQLIAPSLVVV
jgi:hypothetical protein